MRPIVLQVGDRYENLVIREVNKNHCYCECDCGNFCSVGASQLKRHHVRSCGCLRSPAGKANPRWSGYKLIGRWFWTALQANAKGKSRAFDLTIEFLWELFEKQQGKCALSGVELVLEPSQMGARKRQNHTASLDRIESNGGYTKDNVQWVHKTLNAMKSDLPQADFIAWCCTVADHVRKQNQLQ